MTVLAIKDLPLNRALDRKAMSVIRGSGAPWVFGWIRPYVASNPNSGLGTVFNFFQINNTYIADQMNNQIQNVDINNSAANSNINVILNEHSTNQKH
ncbi:hypothetical protein [Noviherbaspirillum sp. Root189]|uniref:hypothetical protein n=1 Tax=Noviherbaspirillum sp. Root189 TaxID=1736487 RepID=UPI00070A7BA6|nr:hypothetical protein [Noviherbaspirillum sp. Root189]KRB64247.1 hypothetical protein ASE07_11615 [Noviherbaspirillum sp. Root189]